MQVRVSVVGGAADGLDVAFGQCPVALGREGDPALPVTDRWASRHHCELFEQAGGLHIRDLASKHGTFVNGRRVDECRLEVGDRVMVGMTLFMIAEILTSSDVAEPLVDRGSSVGA